MDRRPKLHRLVQGPPMNGVFLFNQCMGNREDLVQLLQTTLLRRQQVSHLFNPPPTLTRPRLRLYLRLQPVIRCKLAIPTLQTARPNTVVV